MVKENINKEYDAPMIEQIEARVEKGFLASVTSIPDEGNHGTEKTDNSGRTYMFT